MDDRYAEATNVVVGESPVIGKIDLLQQAGAMAAHASQRQSVIAENIANADTPGFKARDIEAFNSAGTLPRIGLKATRAAHIQPDTQTANYKPFVETNRAMSPNGNSVSLENELVKSAEAAGSHNRALTIYKASLDILRASLRSR